MMHKHTHATSNFKILLVNWPTKRKFKRVLISFSEIQCGNVVDFFMMILKHCANTIRYTALLAT